MLLRLECPTKEGAIVTKATIETQAQWHHEVLDAGRATREAYEQGEMLDRCDQTACFLFDMAIGMYQMKCWECPICAASSRAWWRLAATLPSIQYDAVRLALKLSGATVPPLVLEAR